MHRRAFLAGVAAFGLTACGGDPSREATPRDGTAGSSAVTSSPRATDTNGTSSTPGPVDGRAPFIPRGSDGTDRVALTFHMDGDVDLAGRLLDLLADRRAVMTAFVVGAWLEANPTMGERLRAGGHEVGNHTYTHPDLGSMGGEAVGEEIRRCAEVLREVVGHPGRWFRPSATEVPSDLMLEQAAIAGYEASIGYSLDSLDHRDPGAPAVVETVGTATGGEIVSLHFGHPGTIEAMPAILDGLDRRGLEPVTVSRL